MICATTNFSAYPFGGGDLHGPGAANSMTTPLAVVQTAADDFLFIAPLDNKVRPKRFYFQPGEKFYRVEAIYEHDGWRNDRRITVPRWRLGYTKTFDGAIQSHMNFIEDAFKLPAWETRADVPAWLRRVAMVTTCMACITPATCSTITRGWARFKWISRANAR